MENWTHSAASKHTTAWTSHTRPSPRKHSSDGATPTKVADIWLQLTTHWSSSELKALVQSSWSQGRKKNFVKVVGVTYSECFLVTDLITQLITLSHEAVFLFAEIAALDMKFFFLVFQLTISFQLFTCSILSSLLLLLLLLLLQTNIIIVPYSLENSEMT